jgi:hypothetical protein
MNMKVVPLVSIILVILQICGMCIRSFYEALVKQIIKIFCFSSQKYENIIATYTLIVLLKSLFKM